MIGCKPLSPEEISVILTYLNPRDSVLFQLGLSTGFRISELLSIKLSDVLENGALKDHILIARGNMKGKKAPRSVPLSPTTKTLLQNYISSLPRQEYLFQSVHGKLSRCQAWRAIAAAAEKSQLTGKIATHSWRKTFCNKVYQASGKDLFLTQLMMGHANPSSTTKYLQPDQEKMDKIWSML